MPASIDYVATEFLLGLEGLVLTSTLALLCSCFIEIPAP